MTWIDDDNAEIERLRQSKAELDAREAQVSSEAAKVYEELWAEIHARITEAKQKGRTHVMVNGSYYERKLIVPDPKNQAIPKEFVLRIGASRSSFTFTGPNTNIVLPLDLCADGIVRIKHEGECRPVEEIARLLLQPLVSPEKFPAS